MATALTPMTALAADMTMERALNPQREPQNWILHHGNYQGHRFSALKEINADTVKNLRLAYTVALGGFQSGGRYAFGDLEATPIVEDGMMYVPDGWGSVYAIDLTNGRRGSIKWKMDPGTDRNWAGDVACCGVNNRGVALWKDKIISISLDGRMFSVNKATGEVVWERKIAEPALGETLTVAPLVIRTSRSSAPPAASSASAASSRRPTSTPARPPGAPTPSPAPASPATRPGRTARIAGSTAAGRSGRPRPTTRTATPSTRASAMPARTTTSRTGRATTNGRRACSRSMPTDGKIKWGFQYTPQDPYDYDEISEHPIINAKVNGEDRKLVVHAARNGFFYALDRTNGSFIAGKQYVDQLTWTTGLDPKTGKPLNYDPNSDIQIYSPGSHGMRGQPAGRTCPTNSGGKNWEPTAYNPELGLLYIPSIEGCNFIETVEQKDFADQGGTVKPRERFTGGSTKSVERRYGSLKAVDPTTGETKANLRLTYPNYSGALATAGNLVFLGHYDGTISAHDAKTLAEVWTFNIGTGINAQVPMLKLHSSCRVLASCAVTLPS